MFCNNKSDTSAMILAVAVQEAPMTQVQMVPMNPAEPCEAVIHDDHPHSNLAQQTSTAEPTCNKPATDATSAAAVTGIATLSSNDKHTPACELTHSSHARSQHSSLHQKGRGCKRARPSSSHKGPVGLGAATPLKDRTIPGTLKRKAEAAPLHMLSSSVKMLKKCADVIDLTSDLDTPFTSQLSQVIRAASPQADRHEVITAGTKEESGSAMLRGLSSCSYQFA